MIDRSTKVESHVTGQSGSPIPRWVSAAVAVGALLILTGAVISKVDPSMLASSGAARVFTDYLFARNLPLAMALLFFLGIGARRMLAGFMVLTASIQALDVLDALFRGDVELVPGLTIFVIVFLIGASRLVERPLWNVDSWRDASSATLRPS